MNRRENLSVLARCVIVAILLASAASPALAQLARRPFEVVGGEGGGAATGIVGWLLAEQARLVHLMTAWLKSLRSDGSAIWGLSGLGFLYGVVHAAGPGHGKALIASYMLANERALRRGVVLAFFAAFLQALVAIALVGVAALIFRATASEMNNVAFYIEITSYSAISAVGAWLVWMKGRAFVAALRLQGFARAPFTGSAFFLQLQWRPALASDPASRFRAETPGQTLSDDACGHIHAPDPATLDSEFSWRAAASTVFAAGVRPCSGAVLILVFALAQGFFLAGIEAILAMAVGTAVTTGALAMLAVLAKGVALRIARRRSSLAGLIAKGVEFGAALIVLAFGLALLLHGSSGGA